MFVPVAESCLFVAAGVVSVALQGMGTSTKPITQLLCIFSSNFTQSIKTEAMGPYHSVERLQEVRSKAL